MSASLSWIHWICLSGALVLAFRVFRDLGDVTQFVLRVKRSTVIRTFRYRRELSASAALLLLGAALTHAAGAGHPVVFWCSFALALLFLFQGFVYPGIAMRSQQRTARFYSIEEAKRRVRPEASVIVIEANGEARAHPDYEMWRPHIAGSPDGLGGKDVVLTYCSLTNLGVAYEPRLDDEPLDLKVCLQLENNLIMYDRNTGEPIQQLWGTPESEGRNGRRLEQWPSYRMTFRGFEKAYPEGRVFLNVRPSFWQNPIVCVWDFLVDILFTVAITAHRRNEEAIFPTIRHRDDRLPNKTEVWGVSVGDDTVAYTEEFVRERGDLVQARIGGRDLVVAYDPDYESLGMYYNDTGKPVHKINFFGDSDQGLLPRVETMKAGAYWVVWANFFPHTDLNRAD